MNENETVTVKDKGNSMLPASIVVAGLIIAGAIFITNNGGGMNTNVKNVDPAQQGAQEPAKPSANAANVNLVTSEDHIYGNPDAPIKIVEYSDFECPFCQRVHGTLKSIVDANDGEVAWVYRHFPLVQIHGDAQRRSEASECVAELGGNDAFWTFTDSIYGLPSVSGVIDIQGLAVSAGVDGEAFSSCLTSRKYQAKVEADIANAAATGGQGTPHSIIIGPKGETFSISGAQPAAAFQQVIDQLK